MKGKILSVESFDSDEEFVYNIEVADNHNYFANNILTQNCHITGAKKIHEVMMWLNAKYRYGTSATPWRLAGDDMRMFASIGEMSKGITATDLIRHPEKYLVPARIQFYQMPRPFDGWQCSDYSKWQVLYREGIVENGPRNQFLAKKSIELVNEGRVTLIMCQYIDHGELLQMELKKMGYEVPFIHGSIAIGKRKTLTKEFRAGKIPMIISSSVWNIGVDFPIVSGMVMAGPYKSQVQNVQRVGRGLRPYPGKVDCKVVEAWDNYLPMIKDWALDRFEYYNSEDAFEVHA